MVAHDLVGTDVGRPSQVVRRNGGKRWSGPDDLRRSSYSCVTWRTQSLSCARNDVPALLLRHVFPDCVFVDLDPQTGTGRDVDVAVLDLKRVRDDYVAEGVLVDVEFEHRLIARKPPGVAGQQREHLQRGGDRKGPR